LEEGEFMSPTVDDRVVGMKFDNANFEAKVAQTMASLDKLNQKLAFAGGVQGFQNVQAAANAVNLNNVASGVDKISSRFDALGAIGFSVIQKLTQNLMSFVAGFVQTDILAPLITGGKTRAQNIEQAQFQFRGLGMNVEEVMANAKSAVLGTAYGLGDAAKAAAQFGASGMGAGKDMTQSLRAIAGTAAMTGSSYSEMAYLFTSAAAQGKITNMDLQQWATRGLNAAAAYGKAVGITEAQVHDMATNGKLDYKSFAKAMDDTFGAHATMANETYSGSLANMHAAMSRLSASLFTPEMQQSRDLFNTLTPFIDNLSAALQPLIKAFIELRGTAIGGLIDFIKKIDFSRFNLAIPNFVGAFKAAFDALKQFLGIIKDAFREIFPPSVISPIFQISLALERFALSLKMGGETAKKVQSIFQGFFAVVAIAWEVFKGLVSVIVDVWHALFPAGQAFLTAGAGVGDFLTKMKEVLVDGGKIHDFFAKLGEIISKPVAAISELTRKIIGFFTQSPDEGGIAAPFVAVGKHIQSLGDFWDAFYEKFQSVFNVLGKIWDSISNWFSELWDKIADAIGGGNYNAVADVLNVGVLAAIAVMLKNFTTGGLKVGLGGGVFGIIQSNLIAVTRTLNQMQAKIQADTIFKIAAAVGILAISMTILAGIPSEKLTKALSAMAVGFGELVATMKILQADVKGSFGLAIISGGLIAVSFAMLILSAAIKNLSDISWEGLSKGLIGIGVGLGLLVATSKLLAGSAPGMISAGLGMIAMSIGLRILANAVEAFGNLSWTELGKGLGAIAIGLGLLTAAMRLMPASSVISGAGFVEMTVGLRIMADVVQEFGKLSWEAIGKGLAGIAVGLLAIAFAMNMMPINLPITAAGLVILSFGLKMMASAVTTMGANDFGSLAKGIGGLAAVLLILVLAMNAMNGSITGAASLFIVSASLTMLAKVMTELSKLSITQIVTSLGAIAAVLLVLGIAAAALQPIIPAMLLLGFALGVIGGAFALFGLGAMLVADAFQVMAAAGVAGTAALLTSLKMILKAIPQFAAAAALFVVSFAANILEGLPTLIKVFTAVLEQILITIIKEVPLIVKALGAIIDGFIVLVVTRAPEIIATAFFLLMTFMQGLRDNMYQIVTVGAEIFINFIKGLTDKIPEIVTAVTNLIVTFLNAIASHMEEIITAGVNVLVQFLAGISDNLDKVMDAVTSLIVRFLEELGKHFLEILAAGANLLDTILYGIFLTLSHIMDTVTSIIKKFTEELGKHVLELMDAGTNLLVQLIKGIGRDIQKIIDAGVDVIIAFIKGIGKNATKLMDAAGQTIVDFLKGLDKAIEKYTPQIRDEGLKIAGHLVDGITGGMATRTKDVWSAGFDLAGGAAKGFWDFIMPGSPSKLFFALAQTIPAGVALALNKDTTAKDSVIVMAERIVNAFQETLNQIPDTLGDMNEFNPVITPVLDLSKVQAESGNIARYLKASIIPKASTQQAGIISASTEVTGGSDVTTSTGPTGIIFNQTNNSPKALTTDEIYKNTRSQITLAKEELGIL
jgi:tape measure domain-containing protein